MFGISYKPDVDVLRPFRALVSWLCHSIGLRPNLTYYAPLGLSYHSPERALYNSEAVSPLAKNNEAVSPLAKNNEAVSPLATNN
ncbi:MAG: hypothetical protein IPI59_12355 [Sphingobacteriales bacterium]|jgi:hypothetical protein|nr:hypothetical protein [Sphingobacteriales bacterium]MBP9140913.1 hypothetical protein [Chitinophagales bacterium]MDA0199239.1 hypothetical protein [Bacteroidota bacterium]MBK7528319.1 hypothetical protein [Sphingobacteriales bacterium]MBK8680223.1 hypothetical protein [Sphingobacteriales bacterium]